MAAVPLMIQGIELDLADAPRQFAGGGKGTGSERGDNRHVHHRHITVLRDNVPAAIDHYGQLSLSFF